VFLFLSWTGGVGAGDPWPLSLSIPGFKVTRRIEGKQAIDAINRLHRMTIDIVKGVIVDFAGEQSSQVTVWVSQARTQAKAQEQVDVMIKKMKGSNKSPFHRYRNWDVRETCIIGFDGMGQTHRVFRKGRWVYWISGQNDDVEDILTHLIAGSGAH
jgi:hypothetical protein